MLTRSALYNTIFAGEHSVEWNISINGTDYGMTDIARSAGGGIALPKITRNMFSGNTPTVGCCVAATFECAIFEASENVPRMSAVVPSYRITNGAQSSEWIALGTFYIDTRTVDKSTGALSLFCYDRMLVADGIDGKSYAEVARLATWPQPMADVVDDIAAIMGITVDSHTSINSGTGYMVDYPNDLTMREVLAYIAVAHCGNWTITPENKLRLVPLTGNSDTYNLGSNVKELDSSSQLMAWSGVTVYWSDENAFTAGTAVGRVLTADCPWATQETANGMLAVIGGESYQAYTANGAFADLALELGDIVTVGLPNDTVTGACFGINTTVDVIESSDITAPGEEEIDHEYPYYSYVDRSLKRKVTLGQSYYGTSISREKGIEIMRSDGASQALFNSDLFQMSALIDGTMTPRIYFDPVKGDYVFDGALGANVVFADSLYAENGDVADLTVDRLITSRRVRKYILGDTSDDNYIHIQDQYIKLITGTVKFQTNIITESGDDLLTESGLPFILEEEGGAAPSVHLKNRYDQYLYWQREPVGHTPQGYPTDADGVQIYATTEVTDWPVMVYDYTELVKSKYAFEQISGEYTPQIVLGAGYGDSSDPDKGKAFIRKNANSFDLWLHNADGEDHGVFIGEEYTDIVKLRKTTVMDFSGWDNGSFSETIDGGRTNTYSVTLDNDGKPLRIVDGEGHETAVVW